MNFVPTTDCGSHQFADVGRQETAKMLTEIQQDNIRGLLNLLQSHDLASLASTVSNYLMNPTNDEEAVTVILRYTESVSELLNRKKITKELVFRYLHQYQVDGVSPSLDKRAMIELLLSHWGETHAQKKSLVKVTAAEHQQSTPPPPVPPKDETQDMSENFVKWFYTLVNMGQSDEGQRFGPEHFWSDCHLLISLEGHNLKIQEERKTGVDAAMLLAQLRSQFNLLFNPNLSEEGVRGTSEPHGAVLIMACGTLHQGEVCAGVFEQKFLLLRDPLMHNNWRVKRSQVHLRASVSGSGQGIPMVTGS